MKNVCKSYALWRSACALSCFAAGCNPSDFAGYADDAPVRVHDVPKGSSKQSDYGSVLATSRASSGELSYIAASAGRGSPIVLNRAWSDGAEEQAFLRCGSESECMAGHEDLGGVLIPFEVWGRGAADERKNCVLAPTNVGTSTQGWVVCESKTGGQQFGLGLGALVSEGERLHYSGFGLPAGHPLGIALLGVHAEQDKGAGGRRNGGLYRVLDRTESSAPPPQAIKLRDPGAGGEEPSFFTSDEDRADLGREVVGIVTASGELLIAVSQPSKQRVIVASFDDELDGPIEQRFVTRACIESPDAELRGFGERLAFGDVTGDGKPELVVGADPIAGVEPGKQALYLYDGAGLPSAAAAASSCPEWNEEAAAIPCRDKDGASCDDAGFGASLALGDFSGDGRDDLLVGAPLSNVRGVSGGAAFIYPGTESGLDLAAATVLTSSKAKARFGAAVGALRSQGDRSEPVVGAPGLSKIFVYTCTSLESGFGVGNLCLP